MTDRQRYMVKNSLLHRYENITGVNHSIGEAIFQLQQVYGVSLVKAKEIFLEVANERNWHLVRCSTSVVTSLSVDGQRGRNRILEWFVKMPDSPYHSHFIVRAN